MTGEIGILNVGAGDTKLVFDKSNPAETIRAGRVVKDMLRRGYALLIEVEPGRWQRAQDFDSERAEYIIADFDSAEARAVDVADLDVKHEQEEALKDAKASADAAGAAAPAPAEAAAPGKLRGRRKTRGVDATSTRAVAVARSAGG